MGGGGRRAMHGRGAGRTDGNEKHSKFGVSQTKAGEREREKRKQAKNRGRDVR